jgi:DNA-directed RNA polymerase subunit omega
LKAELTKKALEKVGDPNLLINLVSRRVRQLNAAGGTGSRPLIADITGLGTADIALVELIEGKLGWELLGEETPEEIKKRKKLA